MQQSTNPCTATSQDHEEPGRALSPDAGMAKRLEEGNLQIKSFYDFYTRGEVFDFASGTNIFDHTYAAYIDDDDVAYYGKTQIRVSDATPQILSECLKQIPDKELYPITPINTTIFTGANPKDFHIKQTLKSWNEIWKGTDYLPRLLLGEIEAFEFLYRNPHPNIVKYHGCIVNRRDRVVGIVMDRYERRFMDYMDDVPAGFDTNACFEKIESAIRHLNGLGWAHNDLNPYNIMLDKDDNPILIDFGSCKPFGEKLMEGGTYGWIEEGKVHAILMVFLSRNAYAGLTTWKIYGFSEKEHDEFALNKLLVWMEKKYAS